MTRVLTFGGPSRAAAVEAFRRVVTDGVAKVLVLPATCEESMAYEEFRGGLDAAVFALETGQYSSVQVEGSKAGSLLAGIYCPHFARGRLADWLAWVEGESLDAGAALESVLAVDGVTYVAISREESPDFDVDRITEQTFPWGDWRLSVGGVRTAGGSWLIRRVDSR